MFIRVQNTKAIRLSSDGPSNLMEQMDKRTKVFVRSTYADLQEERAKKSLKAVIEMNCIPAGWSFSSRDEEQFQSSTTFIDDCD